MNEGGIYMRIFFFNEVESILWSTERDESILW